MATGRASPAFLQALIPRHPVCFTRRREALARTGAYRDHRRVRRSGPLSQGPSRAALSSAASPAGDERARHALPGYRRLGRGHYRQRDLDPSRSCGGRSVRSPARLGDPRFTRRDVFGHLCGYRHRRKNRRPSYRHLHAESPCGKTFRQAVGSGPDNSCRR